MATGTDASSLARLLRYLATLGIVRHTTAGFALTELGTLLRSDIDGSMSALALMYGGPFYRSFAGLTDAVRTGEESFAKVFGAHHFPYLAGDPSLAALFHRSMAASNAMFAELVRVVDFPSAGLVVDVAGGNGELLSRVLGAGPELHGILMDRPEALAVASCRTILGVIAEAMPVHAELLVVERLLPETAGTPSLAVPWDIHMLCNVGGRERTESHYRALLADAGFELTAARPLALDAYVLCARRT